MISDAMIKQYCKELRFGKNLCDNYRKILVSDYADFRAQLLKLELDNRKVTRKNRI